MKVRCEPVAVTAYAGAGKPHLYKHLAWPASDRNDVINEIFLGESRRMDLPDIKTVSVMCRNGFLFLQVEI